MMKPRGNLLYALLGLLFVAALALSGLTACSSSNEAPSGADAGDSGPREHESETWSEIRLGLGHQQHINDPKIVCTSCHENGFKNPGTKPCLVCHTKQAAGQTHAGGATPETKTDCLTCHTFWPRKTTPTCIGCHEKAQGKLAAVTEHRTTECNSCHKVHEKPAVKAMDCTSCHKQRSPLHAAHDGSKGCLDCHSAHGAAVTARTSCSSSSCHTKPAGPKPAMHDSCLTCHTPHQFAASAPATCISCHKQKPTLLAATVPAHAKCNTCHVPHSPKATDATCSNCHTNVHVNHGGEKGTCTSCHAPHSGNLNAKGPACTTCHQNVAASDKAAHAGGTACVACHTTPHAPQVTRGDGTVFCARCHAPITRITAASLGHKDCAKCHGAATHKPTKAPACATCHAAEASTAHAGHQQCTTCHEKHDGKLLANAKTCASCHAQKTGGPHGAIQGGCANCHRPHGPKGLDAPPTCATCHDRAKLPGLHRASSHADCNKCHTSHAPPHPDRATCTGSCHVDRRNHQPAASACNGCHVFRRGT